MRIEGQAALVTGAGSGLGEATARALAAEGARVTLLDFNFDAAQAVAAGIGGFAVKCDVASAESAEAAVYEAADRHGPARILVNCAGVAPARKILGKAGVMPLDEFRRTVEVNLIGSFNLLRLFAAAAADLEPLETGERGVAINTASIAAWEGQIGQTAYAASKGGIVGLTLPAARELAPLGIRVCTIAPGIFETAMLKGLPQAAQDSLGAAVPFPSRLGRPAEFAALALHIIGNPMLNGEAIRLDGALRMGPK
ncbi:SDR family NAD(P)-dependent oxidoreductase [Cereibacter sphaeroides]|uniref:SDR family NAD(P)-dependent oxidoreductase n=1 Tax=Cereibacter sphaeroides TaxID=1063 RepID=UPI001F1716D9|nr:SDR family NAD(P)-dependent oxidoreductase [Cereibacter sphaeroides]MCE6960762.1 SDR family NAD(P)-dependent oxidoreductase [Cereibacter sphaeroides]MCE6969972.1 SDR family NAD(P)-dependent oxidoreductase [Cereibacter sphaeroides]MCE6974360.1 SDR family NAD(P)-dependent oxidoreductase [Cereibacter sphaeroides]